MLETLSVKVGAFAIASMLAQEFAGVDLSNLPGYGIIGAAMLWAWRTTRRAQTEAHDLSIKAHDAALLEYQQVIETLRAENARLREATK